MISNEGPRTGPGCLDLAALRLSTLKAFFDRLSASVGASRTRSGFQSLPPYPNPRREASAVAVPRRRPHGRGPLSFGFIAEWDGSMESPPGGGWGAISEQWSAGRISQHI